jgi:tetratricopeptide (TPR) repeat protein/Cdc6-like AAA superfamily ATPase
MNKQVSLDRPCHDVLAREKELEAIATNFTELQMSGVGHLFITGPPACGKTELSRQFAELVVQQWKAQDIKGYPRAVFMAGKVNGGSLEDFTESLLKMAQWIGCSIAADFAKNISNIGTKLTTLSKNVRYQMKSFKEWLLVIDDLTKSTYQGTSNYWPMPGADDWGRGRVLITTNDRSIVPCSNSQVKELKLSHGLRPSESVCLLQLISKRENMDGAAQLADQLHNIPLSLASAANFVKEEGESWYNYMAQLDTNIQNDSEEILAATQRTYPRTLQAAIVRAVTKIMEGNEQLKSALCLIAVCSPQHPLPIVVAQEFLKTCHKQSSSGSRMTIIQCNLFKVSEDNIRVHPATHEALNELWNSDTEREQTAAVVLKVLVHLEQHASKTQLLLLPHLLHILSHPLPHNEEMDSIAGDAWMLCRNGIDVLGSPCRVRGWQATDKDSLHQQQVCAETALQLYRKVLNEPHAKFVEAYLQLADIYKEMYQLDKALESAQAADEQAQLLPDTPLLRGQSLETLGRIQMDKGENDKAMELFEQSKDVYLTNSEHESLPVASLLTSIGRLYHDRGRNDLAKTNYEHSFKICVHVAEKEGVHSSPLLAAIFASLGRAYLEPNYVDAEKAINLLQKSLRFRYHIYGSDHPVPALTRTALGRAYLVNQQPHVAEVELREALRIQRLMLPDNHPDKAITLNVLGNLQRQRGKWEEAVYLLQQSLDIHTTNFGHDHSDIGFWKNNLAMAMLGVGRAADALKLLLDALEIKRTQFGPHHIEVAITYGCISDAYKALGDMAKAAEYSDKHAEIMRQQTDNTMATALSQQI